MLFLKEDNVIYNNIVYYIDIFITFILLLQIITLCVSNGSATFKNIYMYIYYQFY